MFQGHILPELLVGRTDHFRALSSTGNKRTGRGFGGRVFGFVSSRPSAKLSKSAIRTLQVFFHAFFCQKVQRDSTCFQNKNSQIFG